MSGREPPSLAGGREMVPISSLKEEGDLQSGYLVLDMAEIGTKLDSQSSPTAPPVNAKAMYPVWILIFAVLFRSLGQGPNKLSAGQRDCQRVGHAGGTVPPGVWGRAPASCRPAPKAENALKDEDRRQAIQELGCYQSEGQESNVDFDLVRYWALKGLFSRTDPALEKRTSGANDVQIGDEYPILSAQSFDPQNRGYGTHTAIEGWAGTGKIRLGYKLEEFLMRTANFQVNSAAVHIMAGERRIIVEWTYRDKSAARDFKNQDNQVKSEEKTCGCEFWRPSSRNKGLRKRSGDAGWRYNGRRGEVEGDTDVRGERNRTHVSGLWRGYGAIHPRRNKAGGGEFVWGQGD
ncbi:hypothetical protein C8J57DRAFT_1240286 [Mycena rebaudengoi]|nr:hypothetical protein C8J57DRAFT_1240286 [Mycena rebaudengoi]